MGKILDSKIYVEDIEIHLDKESEFAGNNILDEWGYSKPIVKINEFVIKPDSIKSLHVYVNMFDIPSFNIVIDDYNYQIQESLDNKEDKCVIFIGNKSFYTKFNGIITKIQTSNNNVLNVSGIFYVKELFDYKQEGFVDTSVIDMLTKVCTDTNIGLFTYDNKDLLITPEYYLNPNTQQLTFLSNIISTYTNNLWAIDTFGYLHVGNLETILSKPIDKYSIDGTKREPFEEGPQDILITYNRHKSTDEEIEKKYKYEICAEQMTINTDFSLTKLQSTQSATVYTGSGSGRILDTNIAIGIENSIETENTFSGFLMDKYPLRNERINKMLYGNTIKLVLSNYLIEIVPFTLVNLEIFYDQSADLNTKEIKQNSDGSESIDYNSENDIEKASYRLDKIHSGKHFVAGYSYHYRKSNKNPNNNIFQELILI